MVSIIIVNYNGYQDTIECVESLLAGDAAQAQIIIVDNGSNNDSVSNLQKLSSDRVVVLQSKENLGFSGGNNLGIRYAMEHGAQYVLLLNNDTVIKGAFLSPMLRAAKDYGDQAAVSCKMMYFSEPKKIWYAGGGFDAKTGRVTHRGIGELDCGQYDQREVVSFVSGCCILLPVEMIKAIGLMEEKYFLYCEDTEYCCRIAKYGYQMIYEPAGLLFHKVSASTGRGSDRVTYYTVRNKKYLMDSYIAPKNRLFANGYFLLETVKRVLTKEYALNTVLLAWKDASKNITGPWKN